MVHSFKMFLWHIFFSLYCICFLVNDGYMRTQDRSISSPARCVCIYIHIYIYMRVNESNVIQGQKADSVSAC